MIAHLGFRANIALTPPEAEDLGLTPKSLVNQAVQNGSGIAAGFSRVIRISPGCPLGASASGDRGNAPRRDMVGPNEVKVRRLQ